MKKTLAFLLTLAFAACANEGASAPNYDSSDEDGGKDELPVQSISQGITGAHPLLGVPGVQFSGYPNAWTSDSLLPHTSAMRLTLQCYESLFQDPGGAFNHFRADSSVGSTQLIDKSTDNKWYARADFQTTQANGQTEVGLYRKKVDGSCSTCNWIPVASAFYKTNSSVYPVAGGFTQVSFGNPGNHDPAKAGTGPDGRGICYMDSAAGSTGRMWSDL